MEKCPCTVREKHVNLILQMLNILNNNFHNSLHALSLQFSYSVAKVWKKWFHMFSHFLYLQQQQVETLMLRWFDAASHRLTHSHQPGTGTSQVNMGADEAEGSAFKVTSSIDQMIWCWSTGHRRLRLNPHSSTFSSLLQRRLVSTLLRSFRATLQHLKC